MDKVKRCFQCKAEKDFSLFYKNKSTKDGLSGLCKECQSNNEKINNKLARDYIDGIKKNSSCIKCNEKRYYVLDFHHIDNKDFDITRYAISGTSSFETKKIKLDKELEKCIILCSNCHREFHFLERLEGINTLEYIK